MNSILGPQEQVYWLLHTEKKQPQLTQSLETDVVIVGGGLAGITAAQSFHERGMKVVLLEHYHCGSGASGKSTGFVTPNAELGLAHYLHVYGPEKARALWDFVTSGVTLIRTNIITHNLSCDYQEQDALIVANSVAGFAELEKEYASFTALNYPSSLYTRNELPQYIGSSSYYGGMRFSSTFSMNTYAYIQAMKDMLQKSGVTIYEETPVLKINPHSVDTLYAQVKAKHIIVCADRFIPALEKLTKEIFQVQTFVMASSPLSEKDVAVMFPQEKFLVWDTDLVYQYYRLTGDNRLLIGGSTMWHSFANQTTPHAHSVQKKLHTYIQKRFPEISVNFEYMWPGMIGISKDLQPVVGHDIHHPSIYYVGAATGLPWAAALGNYAAQHILENRTDFDELFSPQRSFPLGNALQTILGKKATFAVSNFISLHR